MQMNRALPSALDSAPDELIDSMPINPKDRHVLALAVHMEAPFVISHNLRDFPDVMCEPFGVRALEPDDFLAALGPDDLHDAVIMMSQRRRRPPISTAQLLDRLNPALPLTVERVRPRGPRS